MIMCQYVNVPIGCAIFSEDMPNGTLTYWHIIILAHYSYIIQTLSTGIFG